MLLLLVLLACKLYYNTTNNGASDLDRLEELLEGHLFGLAWSSESQLDVFFLTSTVAVAAHVLNRNYPEGPSMSNSKRLTALAATTTETLTVSRPETPPRHPSPALTWLNKEEEGAGG